MHCHPSSVDVAHFAQARGALTDPADQRHIPHPRLGYAGVIDERMDLALIDAVARQRPDWHLILLGPRAKIEASAIPARPNVHVLGGKPYADLPAYLSHWDVAMLPFARNAATRYISPTKTPEYLAAGRPVVSTSIPDVVTPYGELGLVQIADDSASFVAAVEAVQRVDRGQWLVRVDGYLTGGSWDATFAAMRLRLDSLVEKRRAGEADVGLDTEQSASLPPHVCAAASSRVSA